MKRGIVFDMDKCIGYFTQIALYIDIIEDLSRTLKVNEYYQMFDMFQEIFRPGIFNVFRYLVKMKKKGKLKVIIYTNNNGPPSWATNIRKYIEYKIKHKLFDRTIKGWKYNNKIIEEKRSGYEKSWDDLIECTRLNKNDKIIFFDDRDEHDGMKHENVDYIKVAPYRSGISHNDFVDKFIKSKLNNKLKINKEDLVRECNRSGYRPRNFKEISNNDIIKPLREFMKLNRKKTRRKVRKGKKTRKKRGGDPTALRRAFPRRNRRVRLNHFLRQQTWRDFEASLNRASRDQIRVTIERYRNDMTRPDSWIINYLNRFKRMVEEWRRARTTQLENTTTEEQQQQNETEVPIGPPTARELAREMGTQTPENN